jgi:uncharacterized protein YqjF (DUF2071 family)
VVLATSACDAFAVIDRLEPRERPAGRPAGFQRWQQLLFLHWELDPAVVAAALPRGLELDTFEGRALVGVVPFTMRDVSPWWSPSVPGVSNFHELNVRTYALCNGRPGVWFFSLDAAATLAVTIARTRWRLPYFRARMQLEAHDGTVHYRSQRLWPGPKPATLDARYRVGKPLALPEPGSLEHFLVERYLLFVEDGRGGLRSGTVHHRPYPLVSVELEHLEHCMLEAAGLPQPRSEPLVHYSPGVDVDVFALEPVASSAM